MQARMSWSPMLAKGSEATDAPKQEHSWWVQTRGRKPVWREEGEQWEMSMEKPLQGLWTIARTLACLPARQEPCRVLSREQT